MLKSTTKRVLVAVGILLTIALLVASCGQAAPTATPTRPAVAGPTPTPGPTPTMLPVTWKMASYGGPTYPIRLMQENMIKLIEQKSNGLMKVQFFPAESLVKLSQGFDATKDNLVQIGLTSATYEPKRMGIVADIANLPWNFDAGKFGQVYRQPGSFYDWVEPYWEKNGLKLLSWPAVPHGEIFVKKEARTIEDLQGRLIRTISSVEPWFKKAGIEPSFIATAEVYEAIQRGTVDGATLAVSSIVTGKYYEVAPWIILANLYTGSLPMIMNLEFYNSLRPDVRQILDDAVLEAEKEFYDFVMKQYAEQIAFLKSQPNVTVYELPPAELARWQALADEANQDLAKKWPDEWPKWEQVWKTIK